MSTTRPAFIAAAVAAAATAVLPRTTRAAALDTLSLDYAYYNVPSLVLKQNGWLEDALAKSGTKVNWVLSLGSNKANSFLAANAVQFGSTAGSARPEWTALVIAKGSPLAAVRDLKGKKIAATRGTDPWFFLLRALRANGLDAADVEIVDLQHPDGRVALERGQVDAWAGLDPHMAASQLEAGSRLLYRNVNFNTFGALNAREDFLAAQPEIVTVVLQQYERARKEVIAHPDAAAKVLAGASHLEDRVAEVEVRERTTYPDPAPGKAFADAIAGVVPIIKAENLVAGGTDLDGAAATLLDPQPVRAALRG
jgi:sulfonate transport system substrate-binding protein